MKKNLFFVALAAIALASCSNEDVLVDENEATTETGTAIGFSTFANTATRAENSSATNKNALETYHTSFDVWGYKNGVAAGDGVDVFVQVPVTYSDPNWTYTTVRYWDKSASGYDFYAAAPSNTNWTFDKTNRKLSYKDYSLTGATIDASATINNAAVFSTDVDLMISTDKTGYNTYTSTDKVNLEFNHILSRFNIGVKKDASVTGVVKLQSVKVYNMKSNGTFNEGADLGTDVLASGTVKRWSDATSPATFTSGVGYATETILTSDVNYVYQALCIPQAVSEETVALNGTGLSSTSKPYIEIAYTIDGEAFKYYYNLANVFNGDATTDVNFCEGWQNNLTITINPATINFDAQVYEWTTKETGAVTVE